MIVVVVKVFAGKDPKPASVNKVFSDMEKAKAWVKAFVKKHKLKDAGGVYQTCEVDNTDYIGLMDDIKA